MATTLPQKLYLQDTNGIPTLSFMHDLSSDPNAAYLSSQYKQVTSPQQLQEAIGKIQSYYNNFISRSVNGSDPYYEKMKTQANTLYGIDASKLDTAGLLNTLKSGGYFGGDVTQALNSISGNYQNSNYSTLTPQEQQQYGFQSPFVQTSSLTNAQQQAQGIASGQLTQIGTAANGQPLYAPSGSPAVLNSQGIKPTQQNVLQSWQQANPQIKIPATIPQDVFNSTATKASVLSKFPQTNLTPGMSGKEVADLQNWLLSQGMSIPSLESGQAKFGFFGPETKAALMAWQQKNGVGTAATQGNYGPLTREAITKLQGAVTKSTAGATDATSALGAGNANLAKANIPEMKIDTTKPMDVNDVNTMFGYYLNSYAERQRKLAEAQKVVSDLLTAGKQSAVTAQGNANYSMTKIGRELQLIKENVAFQVEPFQNEVKALTDQLGIDKDMMNTMLAYGKYIKEVNKPEVQTVGGEIWEQSADGTWRKVGGPGNSTSGSKTLEPSIIPLTEEDRRSLLGAGFSINDVSNIEKDVNSHGLKSTLEDPNLSPSQKSAIEKAYGQKDTAQFFTVDYLKGLFTDDQLKKAADDAGFRHILTSWATEKQNYLEYLMQIVNKQREAGMTDTEILKSMK